MSLPFKRWQILILSSYCANTFQLDSRKLADLFLIDGSIATMASPWKLFRIESSVWMLILVGVKLTRTSTAYHTETEGSKLNNSINPQPLDYTNYRTKPLRNTSNYNYITIIFTKVGTKRRRKKSRINRFGILHHAIAFENILGQVIGPIDGDDTD